jgi:hypothetical protein
VVCNKCSKHRLQLDDLAVRVCDTCFGYATTVPPSTSTATPQSSSLLERGGGYDGGGGARQ